MRQWFFKNTYSRPKEADSLIRNYRIKQHKTINSGEKGFSDSDFPNNHRLLCRTDNMTAFLLGSKQPIE